MAELLSATGMRWNTPFEYARSTDPSGVYCAEVRKQLACELRSRRALSRERTETSSPTSDWHPRSFR